MIYLRKYEPEKHPWGKQHWQPYQNQLMYNDRSCWKSNRVFSKVYLILWHISMFCPNSGAQNLDRKVHIKDPELIIRPYIINIEIEWFANIFRWLAIRKPEKSPWMSINVPGKISTSLFLLLLLDLIDCINFHH